MTFLYTLFLRVGRISFCLLGLGCLSAFGQCSVTIQKVTVSGCYSVSGVSKATISVEVGWEDAPTDDIIVVTTGAQNRTVTPGIITVDYGNNGTTSPSGSQTIVTPQVVAFEIDADGSPGSVMAGFVSTSACSATANFTAPASCLPTVCQTGGLGGMVFNDYNANGVHDDGETNGVAGISVIAYACDGTQYQATTDALGQWTISGSAIAYPVRVEFTNVPTAYLGTSTPHGSGSRTTVQFISGSQCDVDLGVNDPLDYCQSEPLIITPCYVMGDPLQPGSSASADALVGFPYNSSGNPAPKTFTISGQYVGTTWAQAYHKITKQLFSAATLKRHAGLGPGGLDAIYVTDLTNPTAPGTPVYFSVGALGIDVGTIGDNTARGLDADKTVPTADPESFSLIGKVGIGGMSLSNDGTTLYLMNIKENALYALDLTTFNTSKDPADISLKGGPYPVPDLACVNGEQRSWAVKFYKGQVYVGTICDASSGSRSDLQAAVFAFDPITELFNAAPALNFPLTYPKGYPDVSMSDITGWFPWTDNFSDLVSSTYTTPTSYFLDHPQPILSDMEFDIDGSLILAFNDRTGLQSGFRNASPDGDPNNDYTGIIGGDILRAFFKNGSFILENNAKAGPAIGYGPGNNQGPGFGEFYNDDSGVDFNSSLNHAENSLGALALRPGSGEVISGAMDPLGINTPYPFVNWAAGVRHMNNTTGLVEDAYVVYATADTFNDPGAVTDGTFGKAAGLGDMELACDEVRYTEIGNRVWVDTNGDGIQDACEKPLAGVSVSLYKSGTLIATTQTDAAGEYYFSDKNKLSVGTWVGTDADTTLLPNTVYQLVFGTEGQFANDELAIGADKYVLTVANSAAPLANDQNDSDAEIATVDGLTAPVVSFTSGISGWVNHTFDVGLICRNCGLKLTKQVSSATAVVGQVITYTVFLTNTGSAEATNIVVLDSLTNKAGYIPGSETVSTGTYTAGIPVNTWAIASLPANGTATLVYSASVLREGIIYNTARVPGDTTTVCTSVIFRVCPDSDYAIRLSAPEGYTNYQWLRRFNGQETIIYEGSLNSFTATEPGEYRVVVDNGAQSCPQSSCCPQIIVEDSIPSFTVTATPPTCAGNQPQPTGRLTITGLGPDPTAYTYQYSVGNSFDTGTAVPVTAQAVPSDGVLVSDLVSNQTYTVRVFNELGCYRDTTVSIEVTCECHDPVCIPISVKKIVR